MGEELSAISDQRSARTDSGVLLTRLSSFILYPFFLNPVFDLEAEPQAQTRREPRTLLAALKQSEGGKPGPTP